MKKVFFILLCLITAFATHAQGLRIDSTRFYCNSNPTTFEQITDIIQTKDGGFFFTGVAAKPGGGILPSCPGSGRNPVMGKLDSLGNIEWIKNFCDTPVWASTVCQTADGGYAINGGTYPWNSMSIFRYDAMGNYLWRRDYGKNAGSGTLQFITTPDNGFLMLGFATERDSDVLVTYDYPPGAFPTIDWVLMKLDSLGNKQWVRTLGTSDAELNARVICDGKNYYLIGATTSKDHDCADVTGHPGVAVYTIKLDSVGNVLWSKAHGSAFVSKAIYDERDNSILVTGRTNNGGPEFAGIPTHGYDDIFLMKLDTAGNFKWGNLYGTSGNELDGSSLCKAPNGGYFITANASNTLTPTQLISVDSNGQIIQHRKFSNQYGYIARYIFPYKNSFCLFGEAFGTQAPEGTGQNCLANTFFGGSRALTFSTLSVVPLSVTEAPTSTAVFTLSPNSTRNSVEIRFEDAHSKGVLTATNAEGKLVFQQRVAAGKEQLNINTTSWPAGAYLVCFQPDGKPSPCQKLIVQ